MPSVFSSDHTSDLFVRILLHTFIFLCLRLDGTILSDHLIQLAHFHSQHQGGHGHGKNIRYGEGPHHTLDAKEYRQNQESRDKK